MSFPVPVVAAPVRNFFVKALLDEYELSTMMEFPSGNSDTSSLTSKIEFAEFFDVGEFGEGDVPRRTAEAEDPNPRPHPSI